MEMPRVGEEMAEEAGTGMEHEMSEMEMELKIHAIGESQNVAFTLTALGESEFFCSAIF